MQCSLHEGRKFSNGGFSISGNTIRGTVGIGLIRGEHWNEESNTTKTVIYKRPHGQRCVIVINFWLPASRHNWRCHQLFCSIRCPRIAIFRSFKFCTKVLSKFLPIRQGQRAFRYGKVNTCIYQISNTLSSLLGFEYSSGFIKLGFILWLPVFSTGSMVMP